MSAIVDPSAPPIPWDNVLTKQQEHDLWARAQGLPTNLQVHAQWFFGSGDIPRWSGYTIGARVVAAYRARNASVSWMRTTRLPAAEIVAAGGYRP